jgi:hypothetical protein
MLLSYSRDFFLQSILCTVCFGLCLLVFPFPLVNLKVEFLNLLSQFALVLLGRVDIFLELVFELFAGGLEIGKIGL